MVKLLYFGRLGDVTGLNNEAMELPEGIETAGRLREWLDLRFKAEGQLLEPSVRIAVNNEIVFDSHLLGNDDEIAFLPPVGGG